MHFRRPQLIPLLFIIGATILLTGLGFWQVERLQWKNGIVMHMAEAQQMPVLGTLPDDLEGLDYRNVALTGTFQHDKVMHQVGHIQNEGNGFFMMTPFVLEDDGRVVLVNRGFAPEGKESKPEGVQTIKGIIRPLRIKRMFAPQNREDKNVWFFEDIPAMSKYSGYELLPFVVEQVGETARGEYPILSDGKVSFRNDHLNYAITWFSLAIIGLIMFGFYHRVPKTKA